MKGLSYTRHYRLPYSQINLCFPHEPQFECVIEATTLEAFVPGIEGDVVQKLVLLEEVASLERRDSVPYSNF